MGFDLVFTELGLWPSVQGARQQVRARQPGEKFGLDRPTHKVPDAPTFFEMHAQGRGSAVGFRDSCGSRFFGGLSHHLTGPPADPGGGGGEQN